MNKIVLFILIFIFIFNNVSYSQTASDYLILQDIGRYKLTKGLLFRGKIVGAEPKVSRAGDLASGYYTSYETSYAGGEDYSAPKVEVRIYDSTEWLLHEVEDGYRDGEMERLGLVTKGARLRDVSGNKIISLRGSGYSWISTNVVVEISYTDLDGNKPEPLEVIQAYLQKFPSTISPTLVLDKPHDEQWLKDEMERRLWLCDKWFEQLQLGKATQSQVLEEVVKSMNIFLDYREKYYGVNAADDKNLLDGYLTQNDEAKIKTKLQEYKTWWSANKTGSLIGILSIYAHRAYNQVSDIFRKVFSFLTSLWERLLAMFG